MAKTFAQATDTLTKKARRLWFGAHIEYQNINQCPRCGGTDRAHEVYEGFAIMLWRCERCDKEWWT